MIRKFLPVGHGLCCIERFKFSSGDFNIMYDCGSDSRKQIEKCIQEEFKEGEKIDALFISHLHKDHINGIPFLIKYCSIQEILLPVITDSEKEILIGNLCCQGVQKDIFEYQFIENPHKAIKNLEGGTSTKVILVDKTDLDTKDVILWEKALEFNALTDDQIIPVKTYLYSSHNPEWVFLPFNLVGKNQDFEEAYKEVFSEDYTQGCLFDIITVQNKDSLNKLKKVYSKFSNDPNINSMTLYSGFEKSHYIALSDDSSDQAIILDKIYIPNKKSPACNRLGCLYTGDFKASDDRYYQKLKTAYTDYWNSMICIQCPHHGTAYGFNKDFNSSNARYYITSYKKSSNIVKCWSHDFDDKFIGVTDSTKPFFFKIDSGLQDDFKIGSHLKTSSGWSKSIEEQT